MGADGCCHLEGIEDVAISATSWQGLLSPISAELPCGTDLEYDPAFMLLQARVSPRNDTQYGGFHAQPEPTNWAEVERDCMGLLARARDIRLVVLLIRCRCRSEGAHGLRNGLHSLLALLATFPTEVHPQLEVDGEYDPAVRANALAALADPAGLMSEIRELRFGDKALRVSLREIERSQCVPLPEDAMAPDTMRLRLDALRDRHAASFAAMDDACAQVMAIQRWCVETMPDHVPDLDPLVRLLRLASHPGDATVASFDETGVRPVASAPDVPQASPLTGASDRHAARCQIRGARQWLEIHEPSSPVPLLLRQAEYLLGKPFSEVFQAIPADLVERWSCTEEEENDQRQ